MQKPHQGTFASSFGITTLIKHFHFKLQVTTVDLLKLGPLCDKDVIVLASDGLWDVLNNDDVALIVKAALNNTDPADCFRYTVAAQELAVAARGDPAESYRWQMSNGGCASTDDITVFVIPLKPALATPTPINDDIELL